MPEYKKPDIVKKVEDFENEYQRAIEGFAPSNTKPLVASGSGSAGTNTEYSRADHVHPIQTTATNAENTTNATNATNINQNVSTDNNQYPILMTPTPDASTNQGYQTPIFSTTVKMIPGTSEVDANMFYGDLQGNITGNVSGSSGSCTGNAASATTATNVTNATNATKSGNGTQIDTGYLPIAGGSVTTMFSTPYTMPDNNIDLSKSNVFYRDLSSASSASFSITNAVASKASCFTIELKLSKYIPIQWPTNVRFADGLGYTDEANFQYTNVVYQFVTHNGGGNWYGTKLKTGNVLNTSGVLSNYLVTESGASTRKITSVVNENTNPGQTTTRNNHTLEYMDAYGRKRKVLVYNEYAYDGIDGYYSYIIVDDSFSVTSNSLSGLRYFPILNSKGNSYVDGINCGTGSNYSYTPTQLSDNEINNLWAASMDPRTDSQAYRDLYAHIGQPSLSSILNDRTKNPFTPRRVFGSELDDDISYELQIPTFDTLLRMFFERATISSNTWPYVHTINGIVQTSTNISVALSSTPYDQYHLIGITNTGRVVAVSINDTFSPDEEYYTISGNIKVYHKRISPVSDLTDPMIIHQTHSKRKIWRHPNGLGSVVQYDYKGYRHQLFVADAQYRGVAKWANASTNIPSPYTPKYQNSIFTNGTQYITGVAKEGQITMSDKELEEATNFNYVLPSQDMMDLVRIAGIDTYPAFKLAWYANETPNALDPIDFKLNVPNILELLIIYLEASAIDILDRSVKSEDYNESGNYLASRNPTGFWKFAGTTSNRYRAFSCTEWSNDYVWSVGYNGLITGYLSGTTGSKTDVFFVIPVKELSCEKITEYRLSPNGNGTPAITTTAGRKLYRHENNMGTVMEYKENGISKSMFIPDAAYRCTRYGSNLTMPISTLILANDQQTALTNLSMNLQFDLPANYVLFSGNSTTSNPARYFYLDTLASSSITNYVDKWKSITDTVLDNDTHTIIDENSAQHNTDELCKTIKMIDNGNLATQVRQNIIINGVPCDIPTIGQLTRICLEADNLDNLDPTILSGSSALKNTALGRQNPQGYFNFKRNSAGSNNFSDFAVSSTLYSDNKFWGMYAGITGVAGLLSGGSQPLLSTVPIIEIDTGPSVVVSKSGRKFWRHESGMGTVMEWYDGSAKRQTLVLDAKYRNSTKWGTTSSVIPGLEKHDTFTTPFSDNPGILGGPYDPTKPLIPYTDAQIDARLAWKDSKSSSENMDAAFKDGLEKYPAFQWCNWQVVGHTRAVLPNIQTLIRIFIEGEILDEMDPTIPMYYRHALSRKGLRGKHLTFDDTQDITWPHVHCSTICGKDNKYVFSIRCSDTRAAAASTQGCLFSQYTVGGTTYGHDYTHKEAVVPIIELGTKSNTMVLETQDGRILARNAEDTGTIMKYYGKRYNPNTNITDIMYLTALVMDAKYRTTSTWANPLFANIDIPDMPNENSPKNAAAGYYLNGGSANLTAGTSRCDDTTIINQWGNNLCSKTPYTSEYLTTAMINGAKSPGAMWARTIMSNGIRCDLPDMDILMRMFFEANNLDNMDPTAIEYQKMCLGSWNTNGAWKVGNVAYAMSCIEATATQAETVGNDGKAGLYSTNKSTVEFVAPIKAGQEMPVSGSSGNYINTNFNTIEWLGEGLYS